MFAFSVGVLKHGLRARYTTVRCELQQAKTRYASMPIDLTDVRSVAEYLLWAGKGHNAPRAKQAAENNVRVVQMRTKLTVSQLSAAFVRKRYFISRVQLKCDGTR